MAIKLKTKVGLERGDGYFIGVVKKIKGDKALVYFKSRDISRWCSKKNLEEVVKGKKKK